MLAHNGYEVATRSIASFNIVLSLGSASLLALLASDPLSPGINSKLNGQPLRIQYRQG